MRGAKHNDTTAPKYQVLRRRLPATSNLLHPPGQRPGWRWCRPANGSLFSHTLTPPMELRAVFRAATFASTCLATLALA